jgi:hypothetical protein
MKKLTLGLCLLALASVCSADILVSSQGILNDPNGIFEQSFTYNPATQGGTIIIQTLGYGGSANGSILGPTGRNLAGNVISPGGFDSMVTLFAGAAGGGGLQLAFNDDGICGPGRGTTDGGLCRDSTIVISGLAAGTYTVALSAFNNQPGATETTPFGGGGTFNGRTQNFAIDVAAVPEPMTFGLMGVGLLGLGLLRRRLKK